MKSSATPLTWTGARGRGQNHFRNVFPEVADERARRRDAATQILIRRMADDKKAPRHDCREALRIWNRLTPGGVISASCGAGGCETVLRLRLVRVPAGVVVIACVVTVIVAALIAGIPTDSFVVAVAIGLIAGSVDVETDRGDRVEGRQLQTDFLPVEDVGERRGASVQCDQRGACDVVGGRRRAAVG